MSLRPSSSRSSLTFPAAPSVSCIVPTSLVSRCSASIPAGAVSLPEIHDLGAGRFPQVRGSDPEDGIGGPGGRPHLLIALEIPVHHDSNRPGEPERRRAADGEPRGLSCLVGARPADLG